MYCYSLFNQQPHPDFHMGKYQKRDRISRLISWGHWFTLANIALCLLIGLLYIESMGHTGTSLGNLYLIINWLGHFAFLPFVFFIVLLFPFCLLLPYSKVLRGLGALIASFGLFILLFDAFFFRQYGFHLNTYSLAQMARDAETFFAGASFVALLGVIFGFLLILAIQITLANLSWKRLERLRGHKVGPRISAIFVACFLSSHMIHIWADANLYTPITQQDDLLPLSYPSTAKTLMARHGWISADTYQSQRDRLTEAERFGLQYPLSSLLCSKAAYSRPTLIIAFDYLTPAQQSTVDQDINALRPLATAAVGHHHLQSSSFELIYSLPDIYQPHIYQPTMNRDPILPAYQSTLRDYGYEMYYYHTGNWSVESAPSSIRAQLREWPGAQATQQPLAVLLATSDDFEEIQRTIQSAVRSNQRLIVTALTAADELTPAQTELPRLWREFVVPMWGANLQPQSYTNDFAQIADILPTALNNFMSCADDFRTFSVGRNLESGQHGLPRVHSVNSRFFIFEDEQTTILEQNGELSVYTNDGELRPGVSPPTPVLINSLQELQRFSRSRR